MTTYTLADISPASWMRSATSLVRPWAALDSTLTVSSNFVVDDAGALTADTWKEVASLSGTGVVNFAGIRQGNATSQTVSARLLIDGNVVDSATCGSSTDQTKGLYLVGNTLTAGASVPGFVPFNQSASLEVRASINRSAGQSIKYCFRGTTMAPQAVAGTQLSKLRARMFSPPASFSDTARANISSTNTVFADNAVKDAGTLTADTWKQVETMTGAGVVQYAVVRQNSTSSQMISARLVVDSVVVNQISAATGTQDNNGIVLCGGNAIGNVIAGLSAGFIPFNESAVLEVKSSVNRTAGSSITYTFGGYLT